MLVARQLFRCIRRQERRENSVFALLKDPVQQDQEANGGHEGDLSSHYSSYFMSFIMVGQSTSICIRTSFENMVNVEHVYENSLNA